MGEDDRKTRGIRASSAEFTRYDQVEKPDYHLTEAADRPEDFDEDFAFTTCDLGRLSGNRFDRERLAQELGSAMEEIGFVILEGHRIDPGLFEEAEACVEELFVGCSLEEKLRYRAARHRAVSEGYFPLRETSDIHPDLVEGWVFGRRAFDLDGEQGFDPRAFWPRPELEPRLRRWVQAASQLFLPLMQTILCYLRVDPHGFDDRLRRPQLGQRLNYYPPLEDADRAAGAGRLLGHEDVDLFTLLPAPRIEGLQVLHRHGKWVRMEASPGALILNTGDYLQRLSNDVLPSTTHRVSPPRDARLARLARTSFPLAAYLDADEMLSVLPGLGEPKYEPVKVLTFHTRTTAKFYGDDYAVEADGDPPST